MNSTNTKRVSEVAVGSAAHAFARSVPQPVSGSQTPFVKFPQVVGNQAMLRLLESGAVQAKMGVSQPGDADEASVKLPLPPPSSALVRTHPFQILRIRHMRFRVRRT